MKRILLAAALLLCAMFLGPHGAAVGQTPAPGPEDKIKFEVTQVLFQPGPDHAFDAAIVYVSVNEDSVNLATLTVNVPHVHASDEAIRKARELIVKFGHDAEKDDAWHK